MCSILFGWLLVRWGGVAYGQSQKSEPADGSCLDDVTWLLSPPLPRIFKVPGFITAAVAARIRQVAETQGLKPNPSRLPTTLLDAAMHPVIRETMDRATSELLGIPPHDVQTPSSPSDLDGVPRAPQMRVRMETPDMKLAVGGVHTDGHEWAEGKVTVATVFLYVAPPPSRGGETEFPHVDIALRATAVGDAFIWYNCLPDGTLAGRESHHRAAHLHEGTRWTAIYFAVANRSYCSAGLYPNTAASESELA